ncbi:MAG: peptidase E [Candidatus Berkelbacteria bacterium]|nr:peptidase E [Candidatus Berkelbacteria bacterium]
MSSPLEAHRPSEKEQVKPRLYLSSFELGDRPDELLRLVGENKRTALIVNSSDWGTDDGRKIRLQKQEANLTALGLIPEEVDLRDYFGKSEELKKKLSEFGLVWLKGGNSFVLKRAMEQSGFDTVIKEMLADDALVYGGFSAGAVVAGKSLKGLEMVDDVAVVPEGYKPEFSWDGLNLVDYSIAPHHKSDHPESAAIDKVVAHFEANNMPYKGLRDGEAIVVEGGTEKVVGGQ